MMLHGPVRIQLFLEFLTRQTPIENLYVLRCAHMAYKQVQVLSKAGPDNYSALEAVCVLFNDFQTVSGQVTFQTRMPRSPHPPR